MNRDGPQILSAQKQTSNKVFRGASLSSPGSGQKVGSRRRRQTEVRELQLLEKKDASQTEEHPFACAFPEAGWRSNTEQQEGGGTKR